MPPRGELVYPWPGGGTSWFSPSFSPRTELMYVTTEENTASRMKPTDKEPAGTAAAPNFQGNFFVRQYAVGSDPCAFAQPPLLPCRDGGVGP